MNCLRRAIADTDRRIETDSRGAFRCGSLFGVRLGWILFALMIVAAGCDSPASKRPPRGPATQSDAQNGLFDSVVENLDHLEQFDLAQMLPQICDRLNQWYQQERPASTWHSDPLVNSLSEQDRKLPLVRMLDVNQFRINDGWYLQEAVWMRDVSKTARADQFDDVAVATRLFDWVVRNIQLDKASVVDGSQPIRHRPFETLLYGRGTAEDRAWVFMLLARQQGLDVVMLGLRDDAGAIRPWLPALVASDQLYL
ncbi:MAG TPA: hypothetical protein VHV08_03585, partial [Pirellulales bacterium]|nr:hypothetical protein [Pirellulales bacterium]